MDSIDIIVRLAFKDEDCVKVLIYLDGKQKTIVFHYLSKLDTVPPAMNTLLKFAYSLRIRARFFNGQRVVIDPVPNIKRAINLPASPEEYESLVKGLAQDRGFMLKPGEGSPGKHVSSEYAKSTGKAPTMKSATHCECALVLADSDAFKRGIASTASITSPRKKKKVVIAHWWSLSMI